MPDQQQKITALRRVASQISTNEDLEALLQELTRSACQQGGWDLGSVMCIDLAHGYGLVLARYETSMLPQKVEDRWELATSPSLIALQKGEPVYIRDALETSQFPGYRRDAQARNYRTVLTLPMSSCDAEGRPMVLTVISRTVREVSEEDQTFMSAVVDLGAIAVERAHRRRAQMMANEELQRILGSQRSLLRDVLAGESLEALTSSLGELLNGPVLVADFSASHLLGSGSPASAIYDDVKWQRWLSGSGGRELVTFVRDAIQLHQKTAVMLPIGPDTKVAATIEPLTVDEELVGALLTFGEDQPSTLQKLLLENACFALSVQLMRSVVRYRFETRTLTELFFEIVERRFRDEEDVLSRARRLGLSISAPLRMIVVDFSGHVGQSSNLALESHRAVTQLARQQSVSMHVVTVGSGFVCLVPHEHEQEVVAEARLARRISDALGRLLGHEPIVVLGEVFEGIEPLAREWERCWRMIRVARNFGRSGVLEMPDLGPLPVLIGAADSADVRSFVTGTIGKLVEYDQRNASPYLETLAAYLRSGCRSQHCADAMGLHVTTLRYRLSRIQELFGIEVELPERRFALELAIHLHQLTGNPVNPDASSKKRP